MYWDSEEPRLLVCEAKRPTTQNNRKYSSSTMTRNLTNASPASVSLFIFFFEILHCSLLSLWTNFNYYFLIYLFD